MNPYDHARSSARTFGGAWEDYHPLHSWFDASKATMCHFTHRALRHHYEGVAEAVSLFGPSIRNCDHVEVATEAIALQHIAEDCAFLPSAADWTSGFAPPDWLPGHLPEAAALAEQSARRFGGSPALYHPLHSWFLETSYWTPDLSHLLFRHHAFGIFAAEERFGPGISDGTVAVPTRVIAEHHVRAVLGRTPSLVDFLRRLKGERWMLQATSPQRIGLP